VLPSVEDWTSVLHRVLSCQDEQVCNPDAAATLNVQEHSMLAKVVVVARHELADRDDDDIPARLRRVARSASRTLPPPFASAVLREIRENESFRGAVRERWNDEAIEDAIGGAFLADPSEGMSELVDGATEMRIVRLEQEVARGHDQVESLESQLQEAKRRLSDMRAHHEATRKEMKRSERASKVGLARSVRELEERLERAVNDRRRLYSVIDELRAALEDATRRIARSADRSLRRSAPVAASRSSPLEQPPREPVAFAAWLDAIERSYRPFREPTRRERPQRLHSELAVPDGLTPDTREALISLIEQKPESIVIDGYNVAGILMPGNFSTPNVRASVIAKADRLAAASGAHVIVVFDAAAIEGRPSFVSAGGVDVRFSHGCSADEEIVQIVRRNEATSIVITNDREVREACSEEGCVPVWSTAFVSWSDR